MPKSALTYVDQYRTVGRLGKLEAFIPGSTDQDVQIELPMEWAKMQRCPDHPEARAPDGLGWTAVRAKWARVGWLERPAVMFLCPRGHAWETIFLGYSEGSY